MQSFRLVLLALGFAFFPGCSAAIQPPDMGEIYSRAAQSHDTPRNPVIVIPGILGSRLVDRGSGRVVWGAFSGGYANPQTPDGARLVALPMREGAALADLRDDVEPDGVLDRVRLSLLGLPVELKAYLQILGTLGVGGYRDELLGKAGAVDYGGLHYTCFQFDYDWRRDNVENARRLHRFIAERRAYILANNPAFRDRPDADVKFDIVAHSMGGLITRYYLQFGDADLPADGSVPPITWAGAGQVERAVLIGTPNAGSIEALEELVNGGVIASILPTYPPSVLGTMPSVYQLMPRGRHGAVVDAADHSRRIEDIYDPALWERMRWGLASPEEDNVLRQLLPDGADEGDRRRIALDHLRKCLRRAEQFHAALDQPAALPAGLRLHLFAGDAVPTWSVAAVDSRTGRLRLVEKSPGDGTVIRASALMDERLAGAWSPRLSTPIPWSNVTFLFADHVGLTKDPGFTDNVLYLLLEAPR